MKDRIEYLDIAKGILISLMVLGHIFLTGPVRHFIYTFHMPAFFIVSGVLFKHSTSLSKDFISFLRSKIRVLIIPFLFFEFIGIMTDIICHGITINIKGYIYNTLTQNWNNGPDGFLIQMFCAELLFYLLYRNMKNTNILIASHLLIVLLCFFVPGKSLIIARTIGIYCGFLAFGYYIYPQIKNTILTNCLSFFVTLAVSFFGIYVNNTINEPQKAILYILGAISGSLFVLELSKFIHCRFLSFLGENSIVVLGTHNLLLLPARTYVPNAYSIPMGIILFIGIMLLEFPLITLITQTVPFLVGKKYKKAIN